MASWPSKDLDEVLDYQIDWTARLETAETITSSVIVKVGSVVVDSTSAVTPVVTVWLSGGTENESCMITNRITTNQGRTYDQSVKLRIKSR